MYEISSKHKRNLETLKLPSQGKNTQSRVIRDLKAVIQKIVIFTQMQNKFGTPNLSD